MIVGEGWRRGVEIRKVDPMDGMDGLEAISFECVHLGGEVTVWVEQHEMDSSPVVYFELGAGDQDGERVGLSESDIDALVAWLRKRVPHKRHGLAPKLRFSVLRRDGFRCVYCGATAASGAFLHVDHVTPVYGGGDDSMSNLVTSCASCNVGKGATELEA